MAAVISTDLEPVRTQAYGNWFEFKPGQVKVMQDHIAEFLCFNRKTQGFVSLPEAYLEDIHSAENKKLKDEAVMRGRTAIVDELKRMRHNFEVSTQADIDKSGEKRSFMTEANSSHKEMYRRLALFKNAERDFVDAQGDEIRKLIEQIDGTPSSPVTPKVTPRVQDLSKPA